MSSPIRVHCYSVIPSPYQRDLFYQLSCLPQIQLSVFYLEATVSDSPWPEKSLYSHEKIMPGTCLKWGQSRFHLNWHIPDKKNVDLIILNGYQHSVAQLILYRYTSSIPCIFWGEKMVANAPGMKGKLQILLAQGLHHCSGIAAIGSNAVKDYSHRFPATPIFNIPYYCDLAAFQQDMPQRPRSPITILCCGQMIYRKGIDVLLHAFQRLHQQEYPIKLLLVGREAELPQMLVEISDNVQGSIEFAGFQAPESLPQFFQTADLFVLPSRYDGWGVVVNQALGAGLPIICSDAVGAAHDLVEPGVNGDIFPAGDQNALFHALRHYVDQPHRLQQASQASLKKSKDWVPRIGAERWLDVVQKMTTKQ